MNPPRGRRGGLPPFRVRFLQSSFSVPLLMGGPATKNRMVQTGSVPGESRRSFLSFQILLESVFPLLATGDLTRKA